MRACREVRWVAGRAISELVPDLSKPCVIRGFNQGFGELSPGCEAAIFEALDNCHGDTGVRVIDGRAGQALGKYDASSGDLKPKCCTLSAFLRSLKDLPSGCIRYANTLSVPRTLPSLRVPTNLPELLGKRLTSGSPFLWIGSGGHHTGLHVDRHPNLNYLLCGQKKFWLFSPAATPNVEIAPVFPDLRLNFRSRVDVRDQLSEEDSAIAADGVECLLGASDGIYIPAYWWHAVDSIGINVALNYWWEEVSGHAFSSMLLAFSAGLYGFSAAPSSYRDAWFQIFSKLVFRQYGDPYADLPTDAQGMAGTPSSKSKEWLRIEAIRCCERLKTTCHFKQTETNYELSDSGRQLQGKGDFFLSQADQVLINVFVTPQTLQSALEAAALSAGPVSALELIQNALERGLIEPKE